MKFGTSIIKKPRASNAGFTLVEVLAALLFMAIVIPVTVDGVRVANKAGVAGQRKALAARIAARLLNEAVLANQWSVSMGEVGTSAVQNGIDQETQFHWTIRNEPWNQSAVNETGLAPTSASQMTFKQSGSVTLGNGPAGTSPVTITDVNIFRQVSAEVSYQVQSQNYTVRLSTLLVDYSQ